MPKTSVFSLLKEAYYHWSEKRASRMGAALSFYTIFSIVPLLSLIVLIAGYSLGHIYIESELAHQVGILIGPESGEFIRSLLTISIGGTRDIVVSIASIVVLTIGTLSMLRELKNSMDDLWDVPIPDRSKPWIRMYVRSHLVALSIIPVFIFLLLVSLLFSTLLAIAGSDTSIWFKVGNVVFLTSITSALFAFIFRFIPSRKIPWKEVSIGAFGTALLFMLGKSVIGFYLTHVASTSAFGTAGAFIVILLWIYYSVQIFFFGASMTYVWSKTHGRIPSLW